MDATADVTAAITALELKFLLRLLPYSSYRTVISQITLNSQTKAIERDRICRRLSQRRWVGFNEEVKRFGLTPAGRTLLHLDAVNLLVTPDERLILRGCAQGLVTPGKITAKVPASSRQRLLQGLQQRGLVKIHNTQIKEVWLTDLGQQFLLKDFVPVGAAPVLSLSLLGNYLQFMRQHRAALPSPLPNSALALEVSEETVTDIPTGIATDIPSGSFAH